jgi:hypothetical protein
VSASKSKSKFFIVKRSISTGSYYGGITAYIKVTNPEPGETIYHGDFVKKMMEEDHGPNGSSRTETYVPVDESKVTSETYAGGGDDVETF